MTSLTEVQASLSLFAEAISGESVVFSTVEDQDECWPWREHNASPGVVLPVQLNNRSMFRSMLLHQLLREPHAPLGRTVFDRLVGIVEDHRVVAVIARTYPGALGAEQQLLAAARRELAEISEPLRAATLDRLLYGLRLRSLGAESTDVVRTMAGDPEAYGLAGPALAVIDRVQADDATHQTTVEIAQRLHELLLGVRASRSLSDLVAVLTNEPEDDDGSAEDDAGAGVSLEGGKPSEFVEGDGQGSGQFAGDLDDESITVVEPDDEKGPQGVSLDVGSTGEASAGHERTFVYDEWDYHEQRYRPAWCRVTEERLVGDDHDFIVDVRNRHQELRSRLRRSLLQLPPQELVRVRRSLDGEEIDLDAAIEAVSDRRGGAPVDDRVSIRRDRVARDVATAFLVDLSASTSSPAVAPEPAPPAPASDPMDDPLSYGPLWGSPPIAEPVRRVIDVAKDAVTLMGDALDELGDRYAIYGFSGTGRDGVEFKIGKDFADRSRSAGWAAVAQMKPLRYTRMGPAVRHASAKLRAETARTKLLIVLSDGYPQDTDYGRDRDDRDYGIHDTARALADATQAGIETFCVTIDPAGHDYLRQMCPDRRYLVIDDVESLPEKLADLYLLELRT